MRYIFRSHGYLLLQCAIALCCVGIALSLLLKLHVKSLRAQKTLAAQSWVLLHAANARHIQHFYINSAQHAWQQQLGETLPVPTTRIAWHPEGAMEICWEGAACWQLE